MQTISYLYLIGEWIIRLILIPFIAWRLRPPVALAWIAVISFQPFLGIVGYSLFGDPRLPRKRIAEHARRRKRLQLDIWPMIKNYCVEPPEAEQDASTHLLSVQLGEMPAVRGNSFTLLNDTQEVIERLIEDIDRADCTLHMLFYIWRDDETGQRVTDAVLRARQRGVTCRLLLDAVGSRSFLKNQMARLRAAGVDVHIVLPVNLFRRRFHRIDMRNHRKLVVIDGRLAYTGSQNIVDADYGTKKLVWYDLMMRLQGPIVTQLQSMFMTDWYAETDEKLNPIECFPTPQESGSYILELIPSGPTYRTENLHRLIVAKIYEARQQVMITTPYFIPDDSLLQAIEVARLRGVRIILVLPEHSDQILVSTAQRSYYEQLLEYGAEVYLFQPGLLHSKTLTIDDRFALVGTSNMDVRSFKLNLEMNLILFDPEPIRIVQQQQEAYLTQSRRLYAAEWSKRGMLHEAREAVARLLAPLL